jgi:hypothetical protein
VSMPARTSRSSTVGTSGSQADTPATVGAGTDRISRRPGGTQDIPRVGSHQSSRTRRLRLLKLDDGSGVTRGG